MKTKMIKNPNLIGVLVGITGVVLVMALFQLPMDAWLTPDQQGDRLFANEGYAAAVEKYESPVRKGIADYRDGNFEDAAGYFGRVDDAQSAYNRGNSLIMLGKYDDAIASFERALQFAPDWRNARGNRDLAIARRDKMKPPDDDAGGTGGELRLTKSCLMIEQKIIRKRKR